MDEDVFSFLGKGGILNGLESLWISEVFLKFDFRFVKSGVVIEIVKMFFKYG